MTGPDRNDHPHHDAERDQTPRPAVMGLAGLSAGFGIIGVAIGFATFLGVTATAGGGGDTTGFGPLLASAAGSFIVGILLVAGAVLLWRAHRAARVVIGVGVALLALSSLSRMVVDSITFISVVGTVLSLLALFAMGYLLVSDDVRDHLREGVPLRLR